MTMMGKTTMDDGSDAREPSSSALAADNDDEDKNEMMMEEEEADVEDPPGEEDDASNKGFEEEEGSSASSASSSSWDNGQSSQDNLIAPSSADLLMKENNNNNNNGYGRALSILHSVAIALLITASVLTSTAAYLLTNNNNDDDCGAARQQRVPILCTVVSACIAVAVLAVVVAYAHLVERRHKTTVQVLLKHFCGTSNTSNVSQEQRHHRSAIVLAADDDDDDDDESSTTSRGESGAAAANFAGIRADAKKDGDDASGDETPRTALTQMNSDSDFSASSRGYLNRPNKLRLKTFLEAGGALQQVPNKTKKSGNINSCSAEQRHHGATIAPAAVAASAATAGAVTNTAIADFFPHCTVLFGQIVGFIAWSSERQPAEVFSLLESVYETFDRAAQKYGVVKVETIGNSYVTVTGLPGDQHPEKQHADSMAQFALDCRARLRVVTRRLERTLGPETSQLTMRFGIHSGPVTAGVLRSRLQLFGDTVRTAELMETSGTPGLVQVSEATAGLLSAAGKGDWMIPTDKTVVVEGKGEMSTFWLEEGRSAAYCSRQRRLSCDASVDSSVLSDALTASSPGSVMRPAMNAQMKAGLAANLAAPSSPRRMLKKKKTTVIWEWAKSDNNAKDTTTTKLAIPSLSQHSSGGGGGDPTARLIDWNVSVLVRLLKQIVARRQCKLSGSSLSLQHEEEDGDDFFDEEPPVHRAPPDDDDERPDRDSRKSFLDEVAEIIEIEGFESYRDAVDPDSVRLDDVVVVQLRDYVSRIAGMYRANPFHNFEHACHVQMSMYKLLQRITSPDDICYDDPTASVDKVASDAHNYTFGLTSDPLVQFAVCFSAMIHDVDHPGVSNAQLVKEKAHLAEVFGSSATAEQNSLDLALDLFMEDGYRDLRKCVYGNGAKQKKRFRQLVVNVVLATDIFDKELSALRKNRWKKAFNEVSLTESPREIANRKATIVIEHLIQASDVSHTMQHWEIYLKWNELLFFEQYECGYKSGRGGDKDPSEGWYEGELRFFDCYVIPLARKLKECGVFGVSSDECLTYAIENRNLWRARGEQIVEEMLATDFLTKLRKNQPPSRLRAVKKMQLRKSIFGDM